MQISSSQYTLNKNTRNKTTVIGNKFAIVPFNNLFYKYSHIVCKNMNFRKHAKFYFQQHKYLQKAIDSLFTMETTFLKCWSIKDYLRYEIEKAFISYFVQIIFVKTVYEFNALEKKPIESKYHFVIDFNLHLYHPWSMHWFSEHSIAMVSLLMVI